jgi:hypothetical protein
MKWLPLLGLLACTSIALGSASAAEPMDQLYRYQSEGAPRWVSPENPTGAKGAGSWTARRMRSAG